MDRLWKGNGEVEASKAGQGREKTLLAIAAELAAQDAVRCVELLCIFCLIGRDSGPHEESTPFQGRATHRFAHCIEVEVALLEPFACSETRCYYVF
ncbi:hypothetical protein POTOM_028219 [Populus tomentosa]|uniref:Uncharacterized protein n=1 Tax=Populus tomentosa TaxID=118781 RepID=A0A8X7ZE25_POPTO|nr:hypothetical protein POTOM_028219 [Populus tomentosa]